MAAEPLEPATCLIEKPNEATQSATGENGARHKSKHHQSCAKGSNSLEKVHDLVQDSQTKCQKFITNLFSRAASTNTSLDILSTAFSAAATVFAPLTTVHALSAGSTLATGSKTSIQNEYLNSVTISHIIQAIQSTYGTKLQAYITYLSTVTDANGVDVVAERSTILSYHALCSLPAADGSISSSLQPPITASQQVAMSTTYKVTKTDTAVSVASAIAEQINRDAAFIAAGVKAVPNTPPNGTIALTVPDGLSITWKEPQFSPATGKAVAPESIQLIAGPPVRLTVTFGPGAPQEGDTVTIATGSITKSTGKPAAPPNALPIVPVPATKITLTYMVTSAVKTSVALASDILKKMNSDQDFIKAGVHATEHTGGPNGTIALAGQTRGTLTWMQNKFSPAVGKNSSTESVTYNNGQSATMTIAGTPQPGDKLVVELTVAESLAPATAPVPDIPPAFQLQSLMELQLRPPAAVAGQSVRP